MPSYVWKDKTFTWNESLIKSYVCKVLFIYHIKILSETNFIDFKTAKCICTHNT